MIYFLIGLMIFFAIFGFFLSRSIINPLTVFNFIWIIVVLLYQLELSDLQVSLSNETIITLLINSIAFSFFFLFIYSTKIFNKKKKKNKIISYKIIKILFLFWLVMEFIETVYSGGIPIIWKLTNSSKTYMNYGIPSIHGFMNAIGLVIIILSFYLFLYNKQKLNVVNKKLIYILIIVLLFSLCLITRQVIITALIEMIVIYLYFSKKIPIKKLLVIAFIGIISFGIIGNFRTGYEEFLDVALMKNNSINKNLIGFYWVYMYLTMSIANINEAVNLGINTYGLFPITSTYIPTVIARIIFRQKSLEIPNYLVTKAFNVSGYFIHFYLGYGNLGVAIISSIYGLMGGYLYKKIKKNINEKNILYYAIYLQIIILSFFFNHLLYLPSGFQFVIVWIIFKIKSTGIFENISDVEK